MLNEMIVHETIPNASECGTDQTAHENLSQGMIVEVHTKNDSNFIGQSVLRSKIAYRL